MEDSIVIKIPLKLVYITKIVKISKKHEKTTMNSHAQIEEKCAFDIYLPIYLVSSIVSVYNI